jgi:hypothetical protein
MSRRYTVTLKLVDMHIYIYYSYIFNIGNTNKQICERGEGKT